MIAACLTADPRLEGPVVGVVILGDMSDLVAEIFDLGGFGGIFDEDDS